MRINSKSKVYSMRPDAKPAAYISDGDVITIETLDCYDGMVISEVDEENKIDSSRINPATGPVYVDGSKPGDTLMVEILDIRVADRGIMRISPNFGILKEYIKKSTFKIMKIEDGIIRFNERLRFPVKPMIGVIGTSPSDCEVWNESPGDHGGNMDTRDITIGTKVYLPVNVEGALLSAGDIHASMGDGESSGTGVEVCGEIVAKVSVIKGTGQKRPYIETEKAFYTVCSAPTLEEASKLAVKDAADMISNKLGVSFEEAYMVTSIACNLIISQIVDPLMTVRMEIPKSVLGE